MNLGADKTIKMLDDLIYSMISFKILNDAHCKLSKDQREFFESRICGIEVNKKNILSLYIRETIDKNNIASIKDKNFTLICRLFDRKNESCYNYEYAFQNCKILSLVPTLFIPNDSKEIDGKHIFENSSVIIFKAVVSHETFTDVAMH